MQLFFDDFQSFPIGDFPYDREHSAMGEYNYFPVEGYTGQWYDPIMSFNFRGPSWMITEEDGRHFMEQQRQTPPLPGTPTHPALVAGDKDWQDYTVSAEVRMFETSEPAGLMFRYQTAMASYLFTVGGGKARIEKIEKIKRTVLAEADASVDCDTFHTFAVQAKGDRLTGCLDGKLVVTAEDGTYRTGCIALTADMPAQFTDVTVDADEAENARLVAVKKEREERLAKKRLNMPKPKLWKVIDLQNFGTGRQIRFGHLTGTDEMFFVMAQQQKRVYKDRYANISCLTAVSVETGKVLWQLGEPRSCTGYDNLTADVPLQIYDIDGDGIDEVITARNFKLYILDGRDGSVKKWIWTPKNDLPADELVGIEFKKHAFERLNVDAIRIVNVSGNERPSEILIKDRYSRLWIYDSDLNFKWMFTEFNTGHFPYAYDFNGDGRDEIFSCYNMVSADGKLVWKLPIHNDHTDEIIIGRLDPDRDEDLIAIVSGWEGFMILDTKGNIVARDINGHGQRISAGNYSPNMRGMQICTTTYWGPQGIIYMYDCKGNELWHWEPSSNGNVIAPVNWCGDGTELVLLNGNVRFGGMIDGDGDVVVQFPDDGHPDLSAEVLSLTGDARDEIVLWDDKRMFIYTQDRPAPEGSLEYRPVKYPHWSGSNYRGEFSFPNWVEKE